MKTPTPIKSKIKIAYTHVIIGYVVFCVAVLLAITILLSGFISNNNTAQINNILSLMSEKVNTSFEMMTDYIIEAADLVSAQNGFSFEEDYEELQQTLSNMPYYSIGLIDMDGTVYGSAGEQIDMEKHGFADTANNSDGIYITEPYRSGVTGSNMITLFAPIYQDGDRMGSIFVTYYLETIQNLAYTNILSDQTAVFLMNPYSGNFVNCSADGNNPPGTWSNIRLIKSGIECLRGYDYDIWIDNMKNNNLDNIINFQQDNIAYSQAFIHINGMNNWNLVIRIPITELSDTMRQYVTIATTGATLLVLATLFLAVTLYRREHDKTINLQIQSDADPLTKVMNRRGFNNTMKKLFDQKSTLGKSTFMFVDIDFFKEVNDQYGHDAGDHVLCSVASILKESFKDTGIVARIGGDEFNVFIYESLSHDNINEILRTVQKKFKEIVLPDGTPLPVTFSAGLSVFPNDASELNELINCADKALYHVKENGRKNFYWYKNI